MTEFGLLGPGAGRPSSIDRNRLIDGLLAIPTMKDPTKRQIVLNDLPPNLGGAIDANANPRVHARNIIEACRQYDNGLTQLIRCIGVYEEDSIALSHFTRIVQQVFDTRQEEVNEPLGVLDASQLGSPELTVSAVTARLRQRYYDTVGYRYAVEAWIFSDDGKLLIGRRGPACRDEVGKLECIGGEVISNDLVESLLYRIRERVGEDVEIVVDELLAEEPIRHVEPYGPQHWIIVFFLCRLVGGVPSPVDREKTAELQWLSLAELNELNDDELSRATSRARDLYRARFRMSFYRKIWT
jgi:ADP-ribose pyrophosphatase YjhB (NUDIX family)